MSPITYELLHASVRLPERATERSAGYDVRAALQHVDAVAAMTLTGRQRLLSVEGTGPSRRITIPPRTTALIPLGFKAQLPDGFEAQIRPRSGTSFKTPLRVANAPGTIDADYPNEWMVALTNIGPEDWGIEDGERIAQATFDRYEVLEATLGVVGQTTSRSGGFGSTGTA